MAFRQLRLYGDALLSKKSKPVKEITDNIITLLDDMLETMRHYDGVGIAAPQVGSLRRIVLIEFEDSVYELINPVIISTEGSEPKDEACLSLPGKVATVERPTAVTVEYTDRHAEVRRINAEDTLAVAICHELDHLDGVLYVDRALPDTFRDIERDEQPTKNEKSKPGPDGEAAPDENINAEPAVS